MDAQDQNNAKSFPIEDRSETTNPEKKITTAKMKLQKACKNFAKDCIEISNHPVNHSKLVDGFLLSQCASVNPMVHYIE